MYIHLTHFGCYSNRTFYNNYILHFISKHGDSIKHIQEVYSKLKTHST